MTSREQRLSILVGGFIALAVVGMAGYFLFYAPYSERHAAADDLQKKVDEQEAQVQAIRKNAPRLRDTLKRSLPADQDLARQEYDAAINRLLRDAKVPLTSTSVKPKAVDGKSAPELSPKKPAYNRIAFEVTLKPVDLASTLEVLQRYYRMNLLHQITKFQVKKLDTPNAIKRISSIADRADLEVSFVTEAISLEGADIRRSLLPVPTATGAASGGLGYAALYTSATPDLARGLSPLQLARVLANPDRDYSLLLVKDVFHGPPPPPPPPAPKKTDVPAEQDFQISDDPPKEDTSPFIRLTGIGRNSDGTGAALIEDIASKQEYAIDILLKNGKLQPEVTKYYYVKGHRKAYDSEPVLDISEASSSTARTFRVLGFDDDMLVLASRGDGKPSGPQLRRPYEVRYKFAPGAAFGGVAATAVPPEKIYVWKHGTPLSKLKEVAASDAKGLLKRVLGGPVPTTAISLPSAELAPAPSSLDGR